MCHAAAVSGFHQDNTRRYFRCACCALIFADPASRLSPAEERAVYDLHQNDPADPRYRRFLSRLTNPLLTRLPDTAREGLDFGAGPGPTLSVMLKESGRRMAIYDPFYAPHPAVLDRQYDFVTCTETMEHFHTPHQEWRLLLGILRPGGWLGIMTKLATEPRAFASWHYKNDPTHVSFFSRETFQFLARRDCLHLEFVGNDVMLLQKRVETRASGP